MGYGAIQVQHFIGQVGNAGQVFIGFRRKAHHEVEFYRRPAVMEGIFTGGQKVFFGDALIDDVAQALGPRFRRKGQAALSDLLYLLGDVDGEAVDAQ